MPHSTLFRCLILALQSARQENLKTEDLPAPIPKSQAGWSRRRLVKTGVMAGLTGAVSGLLSDPLFAQASKILQKDARIAVIGAGIAGLNAAYQLQKAGIQTTVYEASGRVGGRMKSIKNALGDGLAIDIGAELINTDHADMLALVKEFGINIYNRNEEADQLEIPKEAFWFDGIAYLVDQVAKDLRPLARQIASDAALLDLDYGMYAPKFDQ